MCIHYYARIKPIITTCYRPLASSRIFLCAKFSLYAQTDEWNEPQLDNMRLGPFMDISSYEKHTQTNEKPRTQQADRL